MGGAYSPRSIISNYQRCINLFPEKNAVAAPVPITHYQRPGLQPLLAAAPAIAPVRCLYRASNDQGFVVVGSGVYFVSPGSPWTLTGLGSITAGRTNPVSMQDNGQEILIVDGSPNGWTVDLATHGFAPVVDLNFPGGDRVDYIDTFLVYNEPGTNFFRTTGSGSPLVFDPLAFAGKAGYPDPIQTLVCNRREILLLGTLKSEVWYDAGLATFPFAALPGAFYEHGAVAKYSAAGTDISVFWLGQDLQGQGVVYKARGYSCVRVSNFALEFAIRKMARTVGIGDAIGYCYQQDGHTFYSLHFPAGDQTWVFDDSLADDPTVAWHQQAWTDTNGIHHRHRGNCHAFMYGENVVGDWENGQIYSMNLTVYTDTVAGVVYPITRVRSFPHIGTGEIEVGPLGRRPVMADGHRVQFHQFIADIESGMSPTPTALVLRYSDDRGRTWSSDVIQAEGALGQFLTWPTWRGLGIARDRVFELEYSHNGEAALNGAWVEGTVLES